MAMNNVSPKNYIKNIGPGVAFPTFGNNGVFFPYDQPEIPTPFTNACPLVIEENREVNVLVEDGREVYIDCQLGF